MTKYFTTKGFKKDGMREAFKARIKRTYRMLFLACKEAGVTHPTSLPMGLGMFLPPIESDEVKKIYHEAQFELLAEEDWGFDTYFLNPGPGTREARQLLDTHGYQFQCQLMLHKKDGKAMATMLAHEGYRTSFLNPSDCIAVMQGCIGYWWECGLGERYAGEEDFCATSTAILARVNICRIWSAVDTGLVESQLKRIHHVCSDSDWMPADMSTQSAGSTTALDHHWPAFPRPHTEEPNPPASTDGLLYPWAQPAPSPDQVPSPDQAVPSVHKMRFFRILWVDSKKHHALHLRPVINNMRQHGIIVDIAHSSKRALEILVRPPPPPQTLLSPQTLLKPFSTYPSVGVGWGRAWVIVNALESKVRNMLPLCRLGSVGEWLWFVACALGSQGAQRVPPASLSLGGPRRYPDQLRADVPVRDQGGEARRRQAGGGRLGARAPHEDRPTDLPPAPLLPHDLRQHEHPQLPRALHPVL